MNMFENIKRPRAETNVINSFITSFEKAKNLYKSKSFSTALPEFHTCYAILSPIYDIRPKTEVLFYLMKTQFYLKMYDECLQTKSTLLNYLLQIQTQKEKYLNIYARVIAYDIIISFIKNSLDDSMKHTLDFISYVKNNETLPDISDKAYLFMRVLKGLLNVGKVSKSKQYELFMNEYNSMIVYIDNKHGNKVKMIKSTMKELYKNFMSTKNRQYIFDELNAWFYKLKYGLNTDNKVVSFLDKKMHIYVRENNYQKLVEMLETFLHLNKIELSTYFGNNMDKYELINEQKNRIVCFDTIFGNFCGAFTIIFNHYFTDAGNNNNTMYNKSSHIKTLSKSFSASVFNKEHFEKRKKELFDQIRKGAEILEKKQTRHYKYYSSCNSMNHIVNNNNNIFDYQDTQSSVFSLFKKRNSIYKCNEFDFGKDIVVPTPSIIEEDSKENCNSNRISRGMIKTSKKNNYRVRSAKTGIFRKGNSVLPGISKLMKRNETHSEHLYCINNDNSNMNSNRTDELKSLLLHCNDNNLTPPTPTSMSNRVGNNKVNYNKTQYTAVTTQNSSYIASIKKQTHFSLRNINNYCKYNIYIYIYLLPFQYSIDIINEYIFKSNSFQTFRPS